MKKKSIIRMIVDILMLILILLEYTKIYTGQLLHEIIGIALLELFIAHNILNIKFYKSLFKGQYNSQRIFTTITDLVFLLCMLFTIILGIPISEKVFKFLDLNGNMTMRKLHTIFGYWGLIILSIHLGLHFKMMFTRLNKILENNKIKKVVIYLIELIIIIFGIKVMIEMNLWDYLIGKASFAIPSENIVISIFNNFTIIISIGLIFYSIKKLLIKNNKGRKKRSE